MSKRILFALFLSTLLLGPALGQTRFTEADLSFTVPEGWTLREFPGLKYHVAMGPVEGGFATNINVVDESFEGSLEEYLGLLGQSLVQYLKDFTILGEGPFVTDQGLEGYKVVCTDNQNGMDIAQVFYVFNKAQRFYVLTSSVHPSYLEAYIGIFDAAMESLAFP